MTNISTIKFQHCGFGALDSHGEPFNPRGFSFPTRLSCQAPKTARGKLSNSLRPSANGASQLYLERRNVIRKVHLHEQAARLGLSFDGAPAGRSPRGCANESAECSLADVADDDPNGSGVELDHRDVRIVSQFKTAHNFVRVLDVSRSANHDLAGARVLQLDKHGNIHSIYHKHRLLTESYYDVLAALPAVVPEGPIGIFGLGAGTVAHLIHRFWPEVEMHGWELDPGVVQAARRFFDLKDLELKERGSSRVRVRVRVRRSNGSYGPWEEESEDVKLGLFQGREADGNLRVRIGDALRSDAAVDGGFAGLIADLFVDGAVIPALQMPDTWRAMRGKLRRGGRIIVNCGGRCVEAETADGDETMRRTLATLAEVFPGELSVTRLSGDADNCIALTGPPPDFHQWRETLPDCLRRCMENWRVHSQAP